MSITAEWWGSGVVNGFWMVDQGVAELSGQVDRARVDAETAKKHVEKYAVMSFGESGLLLTVIGSHDRAVTSVCDGLDGLVERTKFVVEGIAESVLDYRTADDEAGRRFDDLTALMGRGARTPGVRRSGLYARGARFTDPVEPTEVLRDPNIGQQQPLWDFDPRSTDWFNPASWVRETVQELVGWDPFEQSVEWLSGDWTAFERVLFTWVQMGAVGDRVARNLARAAEDLPAVWTGREAVAAQWYLHELAGATAGFGDYCRTLVGHYRSAVEAARAFNELASGVLSELVTAAAIASGAMLARFVPHPATRIAARIALALATSRVVLLAKRLKDGYETFQTALDVFDAAGHTFEYTRMKAPIVQRQSR
ncbi:hypothetical protein [Actinosynnema sp. NPDC023587]|uniref:hypothetical protein n=1 Tax=Actinosynnema sp. NPDC023587 TaxID=3154695 RepID=UPI0033D00D85